nr:putative ribonuclease H-like domain-containing protein [Tanacetum cinerariifolium]
MLSSNGTLKSVHDETHQRVLDFHLDYNPEIPKRKWIAVDQKRSGLMTELIDKQLREREFIRNLERLVGARELEMDYKLMTRKKNNTEPLDETASVLKTFIISLENLLSLKVKIIRCDNGTEFKNADLNQFYGLKGIKRKFSIPRTPQQNGIAKRKNRTLIEAARTFLADLLLHIPFWAEAVNTACYVQNRVLVSKPHNKTPYELLHGRLPRFRNLNEEFAECINNSSNEVNAAGFRNLNEEFAECINNSSNEVNDAGSSVSAAGLNFSNNTNDFSAAGSLVSTAGLNFSNNTNDFSSAGSLVSAAGLNFSNNTNDFSSAGSLVSAAGLNFSNNTNDFSVAGPSVFAAGPNFTYITNDFSAAGPSVSAAGLNYTNNTNDFSAASPSNADMLNLEDLSHNADDVGAEADINNMESIITVSPIP